MNKTNKIYILCFLFTISYFYSYSFSQTQYKNLAYNPKDVRASGFGFPHASSNSEYPCPPLSGSGPCTPDTTFLALNAIDGKTNNLCHGSLACGSWGPQMLSNLWWRVEFGHDVIVDKVVIWIRHDFPHDSYWKDATLVFSDSSKVTIHPDSTSFPQTFTFQSRKTNSLTITNLVPNENKWCGFTEVQAWGYDTLQTSILSNKTIPANYVKNNYILCNILKNKIQLKNVSYYSKSIQIYSVYGVKIANINSENDFNKVINNKLSHGIYLLKTK
jgi:hypothetical protein